MGLPIPKALLQEEAPAFFNERGLGLYPNEDGNTILGLDHNHNEALLHCGFPLSPGLNFALAARVTPGKTGEIWCGRGGSRTLKSWRGTADYKSDGLSDARPFRISCLSTNRVSTSFFILPLSILA